MLFLDSPLEKLFLIMQVSGYLSYQSFVLLYLYIVSMLPTLEIFMFLLHDEGSSLLTTIRNTFGSGRKYTLALVGISVVVIHVFYFLFKLIEILCN